jgi:photosystem II stability/assembly factor-like uncharacterized protein
MLSPQLSESFGEFLFTTDAGESWSRAQTAPERVLGSPHSLCTTPAGLGVALGTEIVSRVPRPALLMASRDGGRTWQSILGAYPGSASPRQMACQGQATIWVAGVTELFRSEDGGVSWDDRAGNFPPDALGRSIENLSFVSPANGALLAGSYLDPGQRLLVTTDGGDHWESLSVPGPLVEALLVSDGVVLAHATGDGSALFLSRDGGSTWQSIGLPPMVDSVDEIQIAAHR